MRKPAPQTVSNLIAAFAVIVAFLGLLQTHRASGKADEALARAEALERADFDSRVRDRLTQIRVKSVRYQLALENFRRVHESLRDMILLNRPALQESSVFEEFLDSVTEIDAIVDEWKVLNRENDKMVERVSAELRYNSGDEALIQEFVSKLDTGILYALDRVEVVSSQRAKIEQFLSEKQAEAVDEASDN